MRKAILIALVMLLLVPALTFSQEKAEEGTTMGKGMMMQKEMAKPAEKDAMQGKHEKMGMMGIMGSMGMMMKKEMVATPDGGVIVMAGNKLLKYDKDLNLLKEVEIKMDFEGMKKTMEKMKEECLMHKEMMEKKEEATEKKE
jgi:hypothetical protein